MASWPHESRLGNRATAESFHSPRVGRIFRLRCLLGIVGDYCGLRGRDEPERDFAARRGKRGLDQGGGKGATTVVATRLRRVDMASALLRRQLAHKIALPRRCLFSSTSSSLAQAAPQSQSPSSSSTSPPGGKNVFNRHIAEDLQGVTASEILAESGTRKDAQMRHFTGEEIWCFFVLLEGMRVHWTDDCSLPLVNFGCAALAKFTSCLHTNSYYSSPSTPGCARCAKAYLGT